MSVVASFHHVVPVAAAFFVAAIMLPLAQSATLLAPLDVAVPTVVAIYPASEHDEAAGGSGILISGCGEVVTNFHVVQPCGPMMMCGLADGRIVAAVVVGLDPVGDLALLKIIAPAGAPAGASDGEIPFPHATWNDQHTPRVGDEVWSIGNPFLLACDGVPSVARGIISGVGRYQFPSESFLEYTDCLQTDAAVNPGNSGGGLFDARGSLLGVCGRCSFEKRGRVNVGIGYAITMRQVAHFLGDLRSGRLLDHATLGATYAFDRAGRVVFTDIAPTSDLALQGVQRGDEIVSFAGRAIDSPNTLKNIVGTFPPTWRLPMTIRPRRPSSSVAVRDGNDSLLRTIRVRLQPIHSEATLIERTSALLKPSVPPPPAAPPTGPPPPPTPERERIETPPLVAPMPTIPAIPFYEERRGFANGYFQRQELNRILGTWRAREPHYAIWTLEGTIAGKDGERFRFAADSEGLDVELPATRGRWTTRDPRSEPRGSGGLFAALTLVHLVATRPLLDFGEVVYLGKAPATAEATADSMCWSDLVSVVWDGSSARLFFDDGLLIGIEFWNSASPSLPTEIVFHDGAMSVVCGDEMFATFLLDRPEGEANVQRIGGLTPAARQRDIQRSVGVNPPIELPETPNQRFLTDALACVVKVYGSGRLAGLHGYQSGFFISPRGDILTAWSPVLEGDLMTIVTASGARHTARCDRAAIEASLAVLTLEPTPATDVEFPHFRIDTAHEAVLGAPVFALSNVFNIAEGSEAVTVQSGHVAATTALLMRRGAFESPYRGAVYLLDFTTNNPGAAGGALVDRASGVLLGILGKELRDAATHTWINYAIPTRDIEHALTTAVAPTDVLLPASDERVILPSDAERLLKPWGIALVPEVAPRTPPFIDAVRVGSEAESAGLRSDDLIVRIDGTLTPSLTAIHRAIVTAPRRDRVVFTVERDGTLLDIALPIANR